MPKTTNLIGKRFGRWTVVSRYPIKSKNGSICWNCVCLCGQKRIIRSSSLKSSATKSCGCLKVDKVKVQNKTHGLSESKEYSIWKAMRMRCNNPDHPSYKNYGGRGIKVCKRWNKSFSAFISDIGKRPSPKHTIERINNDGNYCPENCCWATRDRQSRNSRQTHLITYAEKTQCITDWAKEWNINRNTFAALIAKGKTMKYIFDNYSQV